VLHGFLKLPDYAYAVARFFDLGSFCRQLEDALDQRTAELFALQKAAVEHAAVSPIKSLPLQSALGQWAAANPRRPTIPGGPPSTSSAPEVDMTRSAALQDSHEVLHPSYPTFYPEMCTIGIILMFVATWTSLIRGCCSVVL
jgi:hypothetical protein